jgi:hypothetical protein
MRHGVNVLAELQKYTATGWIRISEDNGCITIPTSALTYSSGRSGFASNVCTAPAQSAATTHGGRAWIAMPASGSVAGEIMLGLNLGASASGNTCTPAGALQAATTLNWPQLQGAWNGVSTYDQNPTANVTWGKPNRDLIQRRELF